MNELEKEFWANVDKSGEHWMWTGVKRKRGLGYGVFRSRGAHRWAWQFQHGPIPFRMKVLHRCDIPLCMLHLFLGTQADNMADMRAKGRGTQGARHPNTDLTEEDVAHIRTGAGLATHLMLAELYGVSRTCITRIVGGRRWA